MPKATLTFNLPEEEPEYKTVVNASKLFSCLWDIDQQTRSYLKHGHPFKTADEAIENIREMIDHELLFE